MERRLGLSWTEGGTAPATPPASRVPASAALASWQGPEPAALGALREVVSLGYYRGILNQLDAIAAAHPHNAAFVDAMRDLARQFQFETMSLHLEQMADAS